MLSTIPAPSWPGIIGKTALGKIPSKTCSSVRQMPVATICVERKEEMMTSFRNEMSGLCLPQFGRIFHRASLASEGLVAARSLTGIFYV